MSLNRKISGNLEGDEEDRNCTGGKGIEKTGGRSLCSQLCSEVAVHSLCISLSTFESNQQQV